MRKQKNMTQGAENTPKKRGRGMWIVFYIVAFMIAFVAGAASKVMQPSWAKDYTVKWDDSIGTVYKDIPYGEKEANKFDLYVPADSGRESYGLVVYLHAGGFTTGDKADDIEMLQWLCSKGYVAAGINYTLRNEQNSTASVYSQSMEIKESMPVVVAESEKLGYPIGEMAISGGSAGHCLALLYAYRDAADSPVPVRMTFGAVGPSSFYPEDWGSYGFDKDTEEVKAAAAGLFGIMAGKEITPDMLGTPAYDEAMKEISALLWVDDNTVPTLLCYGAHDKVQSFPASKRLDEALTAHNIPHDYLVLKHSGHGLQNDSKGFHQYYQKVEEYLDTYMPVE
ncbi:MAG: alpha/beta hydrolase [Blautia sp.]|nr:alpha/beta hydrolase [Lachnoclostridium sp.]MCM1211327.1 alpha/beta hydrolase [Blautia sp.]